MLHALFFLASAMPAGGETWTVDDDGPADFARIVDAIPIVSAGDVLLVHAGTYGPFTLQKELSILAFPGEPRPALEGISTVSHTGSFTITGFDIVGLRLKQLSGRVQIDDCEIGPVGPTIDFDTLQIENCWSVLISRTKVLGAQAWYESSNNDAVQVFGSTIAIVDSTVVGGAANTSQAYQAPGAHGLRATSSTVTLAGCTVTGGNGIPVCWAFCCSCSDKGGHAVRAIDSELVIRGSTKHLVMGGNSFFEQNGASVLAENSSVAISGVQHGLISASNSTVLEPAQPEPYLVITGSNDEASVRRVLLYGPNGAQAVVATSFVPALTSILRFEGLVWFDPLSVGSLYALTTEGSNIAEALLLPVPPPQSGFEGMTLIVQAFFPGLPGTFDPTASFATNPASIIYH